MGGKYNIKWDRRQLLSNENKHNKYLTVVGIE